MTIEQTIYDPETIIATAISSVLESIELTTRDVVDAPELQKPRGRCEVVMEMGPHIQGMLRGEANKEATPGTLREIAFEGMVFVDVITDVTIEEHRAYRAKIRNVLATIKDRVNGIYLDAHRINWFETQGSTYEMNPEQGDYRTGLQYKIQFSILDNVWGLLAAEGN